MSDKISRSANYATQAGLFFLVLLGLALPLSIAATNILAGLVLLCLLLSGQYRNRLVSIIRTPYARMALILFAWFFVAGLLGCLLGEVSWKGMFSRLAGYKKVFFVVVMLGLLSSCYDKRAQVYCFLAVLTGALINLLMAFGTNLSGSYWLLSPRGAAGSAIFANTTATGFLICLLYWGAGVAWIYGERFKSLWAGITLASAIFLLNLNLNRTSMVVFFVMSVGLLIVSVRLYRKKKIKSWWRDWFKVALLLGISVYAGNFFNAPRDYHSAAVSGETAVQPKPFTAVKDGLYRSMDSLDKASQGEYGTSVGIRLRFYQNSLSLIADNPVFGCGTGCIEQAYEHFYSKNPKEVMTDNLHNEYINLLVQTGVIGLFIFFLWFSSLFQSKSLDLPYAGTLKVGMGVIFLIFCLFNSGLMDFHEGWLFCYLTTLCVAPYQPKEK